jgi:phosphoglycerate dehydrogenase-like enzyme
MMKGIFFYNEDVGDRVYGPREVVELSELVDMAPVRLDRENWRQHRELLRDVDVILSTWGGPEVDEEFLAAAPNLKVIFYGAGSIKGLMSGAAWERGVRITSAYAANAVPVAEFTLSQILFCLKDGWQMSRRAHAGEQEIWLGSKVVPGAYRTKVGIVSFGMIAKKVCQLLKPFDVEVLVSSSYATPELEREFGVRFASVEEIFETCDCVSLHSPLLPSTRGSITGTHFRSMKPGASFINTARGAVVRQDELIEVLRERPDLTAVLDVTDPEPPAPGSPLLTMPNVVLTPHLAGSFHHECRRMGQYMIDELRRFLNGGDLKWEICREQAKNLA